MNESVDLSKASGEPVSPFWGWRGSRRPDPKFGQLLAGLGGFIIGYAGVMYFANHLAEDQHVLAALLCFLIAAAGVAIAVFLPDPFRSAGIGASIGPVWGGWFLLFMAADDAGVGSLKAAMGLAALTYLGLYLAPKLRGRGVFLAAVLVLVWQFGVVQLADNAFGALESSTSRFDAASSSQTLDQRVGIPVVAELASYTTGSGGFDDEDTDICANEYLSEEFVEEFCSEDGNYTYGSDEDLYPLVEEEFRSSSNPFSEIARVGTDFGNDTSWFTLILGAGYLGAGTLLDRKRRTGIATPFIGTALVLFPLGASATSFDFTALAMDGAEPSAARFGAQWLIAGLILCLVGSTSIVTRRVTAWLGALIATGGLAIWIADIIRPDSFDQGVVTAILIGAVLIGLGFIGSMLLKEGPDTPSQDGPDLAPEPSSDAGAKAPEATTESPVLVGAAVGGAGASSAESVAATEDAVTAAIPDLPVTSDSAGGAQPEGEARSEGFEPPTV